MEVVRAVLVLTRDSLQASQMFDAHGVPSSEDPFRNTHANLFQSLSPFSCQRAVASLASFD